MRIYLKLYATLSDYLPPEARNNKVALEIQPGDSVQAVLEQNRVPENLTHLVLVNGVYVSKEERPCRQLIAEDVLAVWPPIAGG